MSTYDKSRRDFLKMLGAVAITTQFSDLVSEAQSDIPDIDAADRVFITNEVSNTISLIGPRPPFRYVTAGVMPTHAALIHKPLYHGCIDAHGVVPSPDGRMLATSGRGSSNVYLIDTINKKVIGNTPNPFASPTTNSERISSGIIVGRERVAN